MQFGYDKSGSVVLGRHATTLFLDDGEQVRIAAGADRRLRSLGEGSVDWEAVFRRFGRRPGVAVFVDLAQAVFDVPFYDRN